MIQVVDSSALALLINPDASPPIDPVTRKPLEKVRQRIEALISSFGSSDTIVVPTPVLAEVLVRAADGAPELLAQIATFARVRLRSFDERAAIETAVMTKEAVAAGDKRAGSSAPWQKVKFDRQIIAIARVCGASGIYADDLNLCNLARSAGLEVTSTWDLPIPDEGENLFTSAGLSSDGQSRD